MPNPPTTEGFYVTARHGTRVAFLLGPYATHPEAIANVHRVREYVLEYDVRGSLYAFGTARAEPKPGRELPAGRLNDRIGLDA